MGFVCSAYSSLAAAQSDEQDVRRAEGIARNYAAEQLGVDIASLSLSEARVVELGNIGRTIIRFKVIGVGRAFGVDVDASSDEIVEGSSLVTEEGNAAREKAGKLGTVLRERLAADPALQRVPVTIWLNAPTDDKAPPIKPSMSRDTPPLEAAAIAEIAKRAVDRRTQETAAVRASMLKTLQVVDPEARVDDVIPIAYATVGRDFLTTLQSSDDVVEVDLDDDRTTRDLSTATQTLDCVPEVHDDYGINGAGEDIGQVEATGTARIATHDCLDQITQPGTGSADSHATAVAGVMICHFDGLSHGSDLYLGRGTTSSTLQTAGGDARNWGARSLNLSFGVGSDLTVNNHDKYFDDLFFTNWMTVVKSSGNRGNAGCTAGTDGNVTHPGLGYNTITVGNFNDQGTIPRAGDTMQNCSSWRDPSSTNSDRDKPEVAAPGTSISLPNLSNGFTNETGTSIAAPMVTATAALMMNADNQLRINPEVIKAAIMSTARFNIEGNTRLSEFDGVGGINTRDAVDVVRPASTPNANWRSDPINCGSLPYTYNFYAVANRPVRVVIVWMQDPTYTNYTTQPGADLDLDIHSPNGTFIATSNSYDNTYEVVDFTPTTTGTHRATATSYRCDKSPAYIGTAYYQAP